MLFLVFLSTLANSKINEYEIKITAPDAQDESKKTQTIKQDINKKISNLRISENHTMTIRLFSDSNGANMSNYWSIFNSFYSISGLFTLSDKSMTTTIRPRGFEKLYKHSGIYNLEVMVSSSDTASVYDIGTIDFYANGEVMDNWTDVEWDFQVPVKQPRKSIIYLFTLLSYLPLVALIVLLSWNDFNFGYHPSTYHAVFTDGFTILFGYLLYRFYVFWRSINFEDFIAELSMIVPILLVFLHFALKGRAMMVRNDKKQKNE